MELRRPVLLAAGAVLSLLAGLPGALGADGREDPSTAVQAKAVGAVDAVPPGRLGLPGSTSSVETSQSSSGRARSFVLHIPDGLLAPAPLVVALHSHSQGPQRMREYTRLEALADEQGFVVAFPGGAGGSWNSGLCCSPSSRDGVDDVAFLDEVIALVRTKAVIDPSRIGLTGFSNGAMMALRYACERADVVASVAVVAGPLVAPCELSDPVAVLAVHGGKDGVVPLNGGPNEGLDVTFPAIDPSLEPFRAAGGEVRLAVLPEVGHEWMTRARTGVDASGAVWAWIRDHPRAD